MSTAAAPPRLLFTPEDVEAANTAWKCNCGPAALAACLGRTLDAVRAAGFRTIVTPVWPTHGLVRIQFGGPWMKPGVPPRVAYNYTHWIACKSESGTVWLYDVNAPNWMPAAEWEDELVPRLAASYKRADGTWEPSHYWEVRRSS